MKNDKKKTRDRKIWLPGTSASDLMGKQSVRATFRLSSGAIRTVSIVSAQMGIRQKSLFDHLAEDKTALKAIAGKIPLQDPDRKKRISKTFVLSRKTLRSLDEISGECNRSRDLLVEYLIMRLHPLVSGEREKHRKRRVLLEEAAGVLETGENMLEKSGDSLGKEDPLYIWFEKMVSAFRNAHRQIAAFVEKGETAEKGPSGSYNPVGS